MSPLDKALQHAACGLPSFPCFLNKAPTTPRGHKEATADAETLSTIWRRYPGPLIGIPTGSASGFDVLDVDLKGDGAAVAGQWLIDNFARLPSTYTYATQSGGLHFWFQHKAGVRNSASRIAQSVDARGEGGYVIHWPDAGFDVVNLAPPSPWPDWLLDQMAKKRAHLPPPRPAFPSGDASRRYALAALLDGAKKIAATPEGGRNDALNREAFALARFLPSGAISKEELANELAGAAMSAGMEDAEIVATIASAIRARVAA